MFIFDDDLLGQKLDITDEDYANADDGLCQIIDMHTGRFYSNQEWFNIREI